jgi:uncharacterized protein (TIGR03067 family)
LGDDAAFATILEHLPAAHGRSADEVRAMRFRLADAQSTVARKSGYASWPQLARHVEQLRALEGTWVFVALEVDGNSVPAAAIQSSRLLIDGDRFRFESPEAKYEGIFNIDVEAQPHQIHIEFVEGPEAGNWNFGIFRISGDSLEICLDMNGKPCPADFRTAAGSGHAYETLQRISHAKPEAVTGGAPPGEQGSRARPMPRDSACAGAAPAQESTGFEFVESPLLQRLQGEWTAVALVRDGQEFPPAMCRTGRRSATRNEVQIFFGGQLVIHALVRIDATKEPVEIDYRNLAGLARDTIQHGIMEWRGNDACFCMAAPGAARPGDFACPAGSGRTLSQWRPKK